MQNENKSIVDASMNNITRYKATQVEWNKKHIELGILQK